MEGGRERTTHNNKTTCKYSRAEQFMELKSTTRQEHTFVSPSMCEEMDGVQDDGQSFITQQRPLLSRTTKYLKASPLHYLSSTH